MSAETTPLGWGIIGTSAVARQFCTQLRRIPGSRPVHVAGTAPEKASAFAADFKIARSSSSIADLLADKEVRIVYVSSPTRLHAHHAAEAIKAGKSVVCEKPFDTDADRAQSLFEEARRQGLFCMEGMWMRFNPLIQTARDLVRAGKLGDLKHIRAEIGYTSSLSRLEDPQRGPVWDFAVYALSLFQWFLGKPDQVLGATGCPEKPGTVTGTCIWEGITANLTASIESEFGNEAEIIGTRGRIVLGAPFFCPAVIRTTHPEFPGSATGDRLARLAEGVAGKPVQRTRFQRLADPQSGFFFQAQEAERCVRDQLPESPFVSHADTLDVIRTARSLIDSMS